MSGEDFKVGDVVEAEVKKIFPFGAVVRLAGNSSGLIHISQIADDYVTKIDEYLKVGDKVRARIKKIANDGKIDLTLKKAKPAAPPRASAPKKIQPPAVPKFRHGALEQKLDDFLRRQAPDNANGAKNQ